MECPLNSQNVRVLIDEAITYGDLSRAEDLARKALLQACLSEHLGDRMYFTAQLLIIDENFREASRYLDLAIQYNPADGAAYNDRALCMIELGELDGALEFFDRGIAVECDFATIHHNKGWFLNQIGRQEEALKCFRHALFLDPTRAVTYENIADCLHKLGKTEEAIKAYKKAVTFLSPWCVEIKEEIEGIIKTLEANKFIC